MSRLQLISFNICPYVQKSVILLKEKEIDFDIEFIDINEPPQWFLDISPTGKVPVLKVGTEVLFESGVINEYLDEAYGVSLHPQELLKKAQNRAWMEYISALNMYFFQLIMAKDKEAGNIAKDELLQQFKGLEEKAVIKPWFNGEVFSMVDISVAPIFVRLAFIKNSFDIDLLDGLPNCQQWSELLLSRKSVIESVVEKFDNILLDRLKTNESWLIS